MPRVDTGHRGWDRMLVTTWTIHILTSMQLNSKSKSLEVAKIEQTNMKISRPSNNLHLLWNKIRRVRFLVEWIKESWENWKPTCHSCKSNSKKVNINVHKNWIPTILMKVFLTNKKRQMSIFVSTLYSSLLTSLIIFYWDSFHLKFLRIHIHKTN